MTARRVLFLLWMILGSIADAQERSSGSQRLVRPAHAPISVHPTVSLRAGAYDLNNATRSLRPLHPISYGHQNRGTLVHKNHWNAKIVQLRESIWETQKSLGMALYQMRKKSLEHQENQTDSDVSFYDIESDDEEDTDNDDHPRLNQKNRFRSITSLGTSTSGPAQDFMNDVLEYSNKLPLEEWGFFAISSFLSLVTCIYCYGLVSRNLHWDWGMNDYDTFYTTYSILEWCWKVAPDMLCLVAGTTGMMSGLYATCIYSLLAFHGRQLAIQHQVNNPLYHYRTQPLVENFLHRTSSVRHRGFRSFRASLYTLGIQILLLVTFRLPSWVQLRIAILGVLTLIVWKILWDAQSILVRPSALSSEPLIPDSANFTLTETHRSAH